MRKIIKASLLLAATGAVFFASCKKEYHCQCSYNNKVMLNKDLGFEYKSDASTQCTNYDSTVAGEVWNCMLY